MLYHPQFWTGVRLFAEATATAASKRKLAAALSPDVTPLDHRTAHDLNAAMAFLAHILPATPLQAFLANGKEANPARCVAVTGLMDYVGLYVGVRTDSLTASAVRVGWGMMGMLAQWLR